MRAFLLKLAKVSSLIGFCRGSPPQAAAIAKCQQPNRLKKPPFSPIHCIFATIPIGQVKAGTHMSPEDHRALREVAKAIVRMAPIAPLHRD